MRLFRDHRILSEICGNNFMVSMIAPPLVVEDAHLERYMSGSLAQTLLTYYPSCYDAYLAIGVENYVLSLNPAPVRWLVDLYGAETDQRAGIEKLKLTAARGHYLEPYARVSLAVAALRASDRQHARELLQGLVQEFPQNQLYARELARLQ
jgi:hypothetical protein